MTVDTALAGRTVATDSRTLDVAVAVDEGRIVGVGDEDAPPAGRGRIDTTGQVVMPGVVDLHIYVGDHVSTDTYRTVSSAAALGGVTTFIDFVWQAYEGADSPWGESATPLEGLECKRDQQEQSLVDFGLHGGILREDNAVFEEIPALVDDGVTSFKMYIAYEFGVSNGFLKRVFDRLAERDAVGVVHNEDDSVCRAFTAELRAAGEDAPETYPQPHPDYAEAMAAPDTVILATETGAKYYGIHTTCRAVADVFARYRGDGSRVRAETCTRYTTFDDFVCVELGNLPKIAPPICEEDDVEAMFGYLRRGVLSVAPMNHVVPRRADKVDRPWWEGPFGANGAQVSLPVFRDEAVNECGFPYPSLVRVMCSNPARTLDLPSKSTFEPGTDVDIVLFDPDETYTISAGTNASKADYSTYEGREVTGWVTKTLVRGEVVVADGEVVGDPGHGRFVERERPDWSARVGSSVDPTQKEGGSRVG